MDEESELHKEVYARFGLAYYESEVLHRGLCNIYALSTFDSPVNITRPRIEEKLANAFSLTLGKIILETRQFFPENIQGLLNYALEIRNFLAHRFWFDKNYLMFTESGLKQLINELYEYAKFFDDLDKKITNYSKPLFQQFGITDELIQEVFSSLQDGEQDEPLLSQRKPKKTERLVRVWDVDVNDGEIFQVFETDDGVFWQLCDVGLGWTRFSNPDQCWKENVAINQYLPANINPRPNIVEPWNYDFQLAKGRVLSIRRSKREKKYHIRIDVQK